ncbi:MAG: hypothetical protein AVDCRST_MAG71-1227 [uncultured Lysobacter sp.]|uniref:Uncharacterized protein n=1 Tax=uncultured Lysobacter sp. TaxID=271060 RepID=A0A6J4L0P1_9GAMM|nr:MAG: hypothetical protein AVDCRST_MAG71-1227 [uncultured Lysobacter sp.]
MGAIACSSDAPAPPRRRCRGVLLWDEVAAMVQALLPSGRTYLVVVVAAPREFDGSDA